MRCAFFAFLIYVYLIARFLKIYLKLGVKQNIIPQSGIDVHTAFSLVHVFKKYHLALLDP